jgi:membrane protein required for colicin V production
VIILYGGYAGYKKGLLVEILTFLAFIIAIISAFKLTHLVVSLISKNPGVQNPTLPYIAFLLIFILVFIGIYLLSKFLKRILDFTLLGMFDSWAGALLGCCKMAFGISLFLWLTFTAKIQFPKDLISDSVIYPPLIPFAPNVVRWVSHVIPFQDIFPLIKNYLQDKA